LATGRFWKWIGWASVLAYVEDPSAPGRGRRDKGAYWKYLRLAADVQDNVCASLTGLFFLARLANWGATAEIILWPTAFAGLLAAIYTAFLFAQCKGRELWRTPLLGPHLLVQALLGAAGALALLPEAWGGGDETRALAARCLVVLIALQALISLAEVTPHGGTNRRYAARLITHGPYRWLFWIGALLLGALLPLALLSLGSASALLVDAAVVLSLGGMFAFEWCFVMAGQSVPNS